MSTTDLPTQYACFAVHTCTCGFASKDGTPSELNSMIAHMCEQPRPCSLEPDSHLSRFDRAFDHWCRFARKQKNRAGLFREFHGEFDTGVSHVSGEVESDLAACCMC